MGANKQFAHSVFEEEEAASVPGSTFAMKFQRLRRKDCFLMAGETIDHINLQEDILIEIFLRLSVKSLICSRCVCKHWYDLIRNPNFALNHLQYQKNHNKGRLLLQYYKKNAQIYSYALFDDETLASGAYQDIDNFQVNELDLYLEGPVDGLYCLFNREGSIILWNPALREFKTLPLSHPHILPQFTVEINNIGFGIDPISHDYKLVLIRVFVNSVEFHIQPNICVTVYSLSTNTWRLVDYGDFRLCTKSPHLYLSLYRLFLNGTCYWWDECCGVIIAFDMDKEKFREILAPDISDPTSFIDGLTVYNNDNIALLIAKDLFLDFWVMLEEGVWVKQLTLNSASKWFSFVGLWKNDEILLATYNSENSYLEPNSQIVLFNNNTREVRSMGPRGVNLCFRTFVYYESLVSVGCGTKHKGKHESSNTVSDYLCSYRVS